MSRAVITGLGVMSPNGLGAEAFWQATCAAVSGIGTVTRFDVGQYPATLAGEVAGFDATSHLPGRLIPQTDHMTQMALVAADWALADAAVTPGDMQEYDMGVVTANSSGGFEFGQNELRKLWSRGSEHVSAYQSFAWFYAVNTGQISIRNGMRGPSGVIVSDQAGGLDAIGQARRQIRKGTALIVSGGVDAAICPWGWVAQLAGGRMSNSDDPETAFLPFDDRANGHVTGEGGAVILVEDADRAAARGNTDVYATVAGYASTLDPVTPGAAGHGAEAFEWAARSALSDAGVAPHDVDVVFADAAGNLDLDRAEAEVLVSIFGPAGVPVTAPKTMTGRLNSGGASLDVATAALSMRADLIPPTINTRLSADHAIDLVGREPRPASVDTVLVLARGHGGFNSALVLTPA